MIEGLHWLEGRTPRLAALLARAGARIRTNWFAAGAAMGILLGLSAVLIMDAGVAGGWWEQLPPLSRPGNDPTFALWVWHNSGFLVERALVLLVSALIGGLLALVRGRRSRAWLPVRVAEALDRLWGREFEFTSAVVALTENEVTMPAAALGVQIEQQLRAKPPRSLRSIGLGVPGQGVFRALGVVSVLLAGSSLSSYWLATHTPSPGRDSQQATLSQPDSPLHSAFLALQKLADRLEEEARSSADEPSQAEPPAAEDPTAEEKETSTTEGRGEGRAANPSQTGNQGRGESQNPSGVARGRPGQGYQEALLEAAASLRQAADLVAAGGQAAMPYARDLVMRAFNQLLQERVNQGQGAAGIDSLLQEMGSAAGPLLAPGRLAQNPSLWATQGQGQAGAQGQGQGMAQGQGQQQWQGQGQGQRQEQGSKQASGEHSTLAGYSGRPAGVTGGKPELGSGPGQMTGEMTDQMMTGHMTAGATDRYATGQYPTGTSGGEGAANGSPGGSSGDSETEGEQAAGASAGSGRGSGTSAQRFGDPRALALPTTPTGLLSGEIGRGPIWVTESGRLPPGEILEGYSLEGQAEAAGAGIEREDVPLAYREWIRRYFGGP